jgi:hypothetical protein
MSDPVFPNRAEQITPQLLTDLIARQHPGVAVESFAIIESLAYGDGMVSTAGRIVLDLKYTSTTSDLPRRVIIKVARGDAHPRALYANEVAFYQRLRPELKLEAPCALGSTFDPLSGAFGLILADLREHGARFPNVTTGVALAEVRSVLDTLAQLHAKYWESPRFTTDLSWVQSHVSGELHTLFNDPAMVPVVIQYEIDHERFKKEMVQRIRSTGPELYAAVRALQRHQATLPQTLLHGDTHIGNTYLLPGGQGGLLDWQLMVRGYCLHDVTYLLVTALSIEDRRAHEDGLLRYYIERLAAAGVPSPPDFSVAWREYRLAVSWGVYIGWLTTPVANYGWEICVLNHLRLMTAYEDLETAKLIRGIA